MITAITGYPGAGKTLFAVAQMVRAIRNGRRVVANFHSPTNLWRFALWEEMSAEDDCLCVIDEAHMWFSSRAWRDQSRSDLAAFQQHRKRGLDMIWIAQHENRVDAAIREVTATVTRVRRLGPVARYVTRDPMVIGRDGVIKTGFYWWPSWAYNLYFTDEIIGERDGRGYGFGSARRPSAERAQSDAVPALPTPSHVTIDGLGYSVFLTFDEFLERPFRSTDERARFWIIRDGVRLEVPSPVLSYGGKN